MKIEIAEGIRSMLIVEDEALVSAMIEDLAWEMGVRKIATASNLVSAIDVARTADVDIAVLDMRLGADDTDTVADVLAERGIPFVFSSGSDESALAERHRHRPLLGKPFSDDDFRLIVSDTHLLARREREAQLQG